MNFSIVYRSLIVTILFVGMLSCFVVDGTTGTDMMARGKPARDQPPIVTIVNPANGATVTGSVVIDVTVVDPEGIYTIVPTIYIDGTSVATAYSYTWDTTSVADGEHTIYAYAEQPRGRPKPPPQPISGEDTNTVTVSNGGSGGTGDETFTGTVSNTNKDSWHYFDAGLGAINAELSWGNSYDVDMYLYRPSDYINYVARAYTTANPETMSYTADECGLWGIRVNMYSSSGSTTAYTLHVTYMPNTPDTTAPTCQITAPTNGQVVYKTTYVKVNAVDDRTVAHVDFYVDGALKFTDNAAPFSYGWDTTTVADGAHTLGATAFDGAGNSGTATTISVTVDQSAAPVMDVQHYAVIVGISDYEAISDLSYCDEDATDWFNYLISIGYLAENIWVFGDGHSNNYPEYDGYATEANVKAALNDMIALADEDDIINFITSGHGSGDGNGESFLCMWDCDSGESGEDGSMYDHELAAILGGSISKIHVFIDHCYSGGMGPELMALSNGANIYCSTTCTENGYGYDDSSHLNGMWTYWFCEAGLIGNFNSDPNTAMEDCFVWAANNYPKQPPSGDAPMEFDGDSSSPFVI
jgi:hypothetical protein